MNINNGTKISLDLQKDPCGEYEFRDEEIKSAFMKVAQKVLSPQDMQQIASIANQATGGNPVPNKENAMKVVQALGITQQDAQQALQSANGQPAGGQPVSEEIGPLLKEKILTALSGAAMVGGAIIAGMSTTGLVLLVLGYCLLQFAALMPDEESNAKKLASKNPNQEFAKKLGPLKK
jgi:multisubunit Na+/H+ antiporter MnhC subunit